MNVKFFASLLIIFCSLFTQATVAALPNVDANGSALPSLAPMLKKINPAVVNISTFSTQQDSYNPLLNDPFFKRFFNIPKQHEYQAQPKKRQQSAGSGVIVDAKSGTVMTNYHVIKGADDVLVSLIDGRSYHAKVVGSDPDLDIAILSIKSDNLVEINISDSRELEVGDFVAAIGNPFGLGQTVTTGVVSALGRSGLGIEGYENFIQTDASINPGNSGGALVNLAGELVGINTAIIAPAGGNIGIGFAIPVNMAKVSMEQILAHGEVKRGEIGIGIQDLTEDLRDVFELINGQSGVLLTNVIEDSPAYDAGLKSGDVILAVDGDNTKSTAQLRSQIGMKIIGDRVKLTILRDGVQKEIKVKVGKPSSMLANNVISHRLLAGAQFENNSSGKGVLVNNVLLGSPAAYSGLRPNDIIVGANKRKVYDIESFQKALKLSESSMLLQINRNGVSLFIVLS
ncbi:Do family serine endopeptidase [Moritella viscosa]|uniref:Protease Do n=2 Tax=Moritella viscosa TaxID=80854 RepID=A0ABY1HAA6_9GAMM|nr:Do family serine endopeptidase [Moritella viscosa]CED58923.1 trypsin-like serine protease [Moritella viscosa]SGY84357.1 Protease Do [Moritella viscosa]SGY86421.1 Protease Do [Moritella viscosa]SHN98571.1 Protease Do [Moritella viscosa]SHO24580.1 Protease Do [Moritella viscosa]